MSVDCPDWLRDEPELLALLHAVLDRFDRQAGETRQRSILIAAEKHLVSLARGDAVADQSWALLQDLQRRGLLSIRLARRNIYDAQWQGAKLGFSPDSEATLRSWLGRAPVEPAMQVWCRAVACHAQAFANGGEVLLSRRIFINDRTAEEVVAALARIADVRGAVTLRQLSAFAFWGDSKVLDERGDLIAMLFPQLEVRDRPIVVAVFLPSPCMGVLFIENQDTYTAAAEGVPAELRGFALVYASGFRSSAARIRSRAGVLLHYAGPGESKFRSMFERWWFDAGEVVGRSHFWGDLDFAGMQILKTLRARFGEVTAWRTGYEPMLASLIATGGYHGGAAEAGQIDPGSTGCTFADDVLLPAIRSYGRIDQETIVSG